MTNYSSLLLSNQVDIDIDIGYNNSTCGSGCFGGGGCGNNKVQKKATNQHRRNGNCNNRNNRNRNDRNQADNVTDALLASELNELSVQERERVYEEVHGVAPRIEETPELVQDALCELEMALAKNIPRSRKKALDRAIFLKPSLEKDRRFQLMFLRADQYDAIKAARRMCNYFTNKLELFGGEKLVKKITLDDLNEQDMAAVNTGSVHILTEKDNAGRTVWFVAQRYYKYKYWQNQVRYLWYILMAGLEDDEAQLNGLVNVCHCVDMDQTEQNFTQMITKAGSLLIDLPFRLAGLHYCYDNPRLRPALSLFQMAVGKQYRLRFRTHFGSNLEAQYALMTFGIPMHSTPIRSDGSMKMELNERYLTERRSKEAQWKKDEEEEQCNNKYSLIMYPSSTDVLLGRGKPYHTYSGNQVLAQAIELRREEYHQQKTEKQQKTYLSMDVVQCIQVRGGRFLQRIPGKGWEEVSVVAARAKVSQCFRTKPSRRPLNKTPEVPSQQEEGGSRSVSGSGSDGDGQSSNGNKRLRYDEDLLSRNDNDEIYGDDDNDDDDAFII